MPELLAAGKFEQQAILSVLKHAREERRFRQKDLADALGVSQSYVSKYESGERGIEGWEILRICEALSLPAVAFMGRVDSELRRIRTRSAAARAAKDKPHDDEDNR